MILWPVLKSVDRESERMLELFLDIPEETVRSLLEKCENFTA